MTRDNFSPTRVGLALDRAHPARMYDYYLDGKDHFPADREAAEKALEVFPHLRTTARENRAFLRRATAHLTRAGYRQFLDIGTGVPTTPNLHEVAQSIAKEARVVYADNDPLVLTQARALLTSDPAGRTAYLHGDLREPEGILAAPELADALDLTRPVVLSLVAVLHFIPDAFDPYGIVATLLAGLPPGSALMLSHITADHDPAPMAELVATYEAAGIPVQARSREQVARFFTGLDLDAPGLTCCQRWNLDTAAADAPTDAEVSCYAAVGRA
ncbi:SAM-dependent methyltransferase [Pseudofrankia sp. DC12]|uniref:SAM-dependent methyltransferase n=1 Tax=Pseudofrankia sp. DC12 TaxID=683315 RepID=UPI0005F829AE|nr:SAM-dependent methyltransferase [Pseudofrankia sp. DC12]